MFSFPSLHVKKTGCYSRKSGNQGLGSLRRIDGKLEGLFLWKNPVLPHGFLHVKKTGCHS
jgi:hypothetical protein